MERAMRGALRTAGLSPHEVGLINAHGTGTPMNDAAEAAAIGRIFNRPIPVTSNKSQFGHLSAAAGAMELAACIAMLQSGCITPTVNTGGRGVEPGIDLVGKPRFAEIDTVLSNSFGFGGQNSTLIVRRWKR
jgi:3-oxoacyl-[acyl-carrier-protein] synthase II